MSSIAVASNNCDLAASSSPSSQSANASNNNSNSSTPSSGGSSSASSSSSSTVTLSPSASMSNLLPSSPVATANTPTNFWTLTSRQQQPMQPDATHSTPINNNAAAGVNPNVSNSSGRVVSKVIGPLPVGNSLSPISPSHGLASWPSSGQQSSTSSMSSNGAEQDVNPLDNWIYTTTNSSTSSSATLSLSNGTSGASLNNANNFLLNNSHGDSALGSFSNNKSWNGDVSLMTKLIGSSKLNDSGFIDHPSNGENGSGSRLFAASSSQLNNNANAGSTSQSGGLNMSALYDAIVRSPTGSSSSSDAAVLQQQQQQSQPMNRKQTGDNVTDLLASMNIEHDQFFGYNPQKAKQAPASKLLAKSSEHEASDPAYACLASRIYNLENNNEAARGAVADNCNRCYDDTMGARGNQASSSASLPLPEIDQQAMMQQKFNAAVGSNLAAAAGNQRMSVPLNTISPAQYMYLQKVMSNACYGNNAAAAANAMSPMSPVNPHLQAMQSCFPGMGAAAHGNSANANSNMLAAAAVAAVANNKTFNAPGMVNNHSLMPGHHQGSSSTWNASPAQNVAGKPIRRPQHAMSSMMDASSKQQQQQAAASMAMMANPALARSSNALLANNFRRSNSPAFVDDTLLRGIVNNFMQQQQQQQQQGMFPAPAFEGRGVHRNDAMMTPGSHGSNGGSGAAAAAVLASGSGFNGSGHPQQQQQESLPAWLNSNNSNSSNGSGSSRFLIGNNMPSYGGSNNSSGVSCVVLDQASASNSSGQNSNGQHTLPATDDPLVKKQICEVRANEHKSKARCESYQTGNHSPHFVRWMGRRQEPANMQAGVSSKVFLGGLPWDITEEELLETFATFGAVTIEWPNKDHVEKAHGKGYAYAVFADSKSVVTLLQRCQKDRAKDNENIWEFFFGFSRRHNKTMQIIPWFTADNEWASDPMYLSSASQPTTPLSSSSSPSPTSGMSPSGSATPVNSTTANNTTSPPATPPAGTRLTAFVGALHGQMTAVMLRIIFEEKFGKVVSVYLDTDKHKYPIGSGRVVFAEQKAFRQAIEAGFVDVQTQHIFKRIQIDPYLEEQACWMCNGARSGDYFCRSFECFRYFCPECFYDFHTSLELNRNSVVTGHVPIARSTASARSGNNGASNGNSNGSTAHVATSPRNSVMSPASTSSSNAASTDSPLGGSSDAQSSLQSPSSQHTAGLFNANHRHYLVSMGGTGNQSAASPNSLVNTPHFACLPSDWPLEPRN